MIKNNVLKKELVISLNKMTRLQEKYDKKIKPNLMKEFGMKNINEVPKLKKIVLKYLNYLEINGNM